MTDVHQLERNLIANKNVIMSPHCSEGTHQPRTFSDEDIDAGRHPHQDAVPPLMALNLPIKTSATMIPALLN